jgi:hypothetical protein
MIRSFTIAAVLLSSSGFAAPFEIRDTGQGSSQLYLQCFIGGMLQSCFLDTGSNRNTIRADQFSAQLPVVGKSQFSGASGTAKECETVSAPEVRIDSLVRASQLFTRCSDASDFPTTIGITYFENTSFELNFAKAQLVSPALKPSLLVTYPLRRLEKGHRIISVQIANETVSAVFDTGAGLTSIDEEFVKSHPTSFVFIQDIPAKDVTGTTFMMKLYQMKSLTIGGRVIPDDYVLAMPIVTSLKKYLGDVPLILGLNHIQKLNWYFDLSENTWGILK